MRTKKKNLIYSIALVLLVVSFMKLNCSFASFDYGITEITCTPNPLQRNEYMRIFVDFYDYKDVLTLHMLVCNISPTYELETEPISMIMDDNSDWHGIYLVEQENGTEIGYQIKITYKDASNVILPNSLDFLGKTNIVEPEDGVYFFSAGVVGGEEVSTSNSTSSSDNTETSINLTNWVIIGAIFAIVSSVIIRRRK